jgi:hypothetical protein
MNKEYKVQFDVFTKLLWACIFALLYALGGIEFKWIRRFIAPVWLGGGLYLFSRDWRTLLQVPLLIAGLHMGYGADAFWHKVLRRFIAGLCLSSSNAIHLLDKNFNAKRFWGMFGWSMLIIPITHIVLGVFNPVEARAEELLIGLMVGLSSLFIINDKES